MPAPTRAAAPHVLMRTTLQMDENLSPSAIGQMIAALQRVPGVLLAEVGPGTARTVVAHDSAVPSASLLEAAARTGVRLKFVTDTRAPAANFDPTQPLAGIPVRSLLILAAALVFLPIFDAALSPRLENSHFALPVLLYSIVALTVAFTLLRRRP